MVYRSDSGVAVEAEGTLLSGPSPPKLQTSPRHSLLCPVLRYNSQVHIENISPFNTLQCETVNEYKDYIVNEYLRNTVSIVD